MKIGIITMHRVRNIGSILQAYATQKEIERQGFCSEIIDYVYAPKRKFSIKMVINRFSSFLLNLFLGFPMQKYNRKINSFYNSHLKCSSISYNQHSIKLNPPEYDVYCTGSDQVWNPRFIANDTTFMLDFVSDNKPKIAYASSFATDQIPLKYEDLYKKYLSRYNEITVREQSGVELVKKLTGKEAYVVCDPTLLIKANDWFELAKDSEISFDKPYILVYFLGYMFDPRPYLYDIVNDIQHKLNLPVYYFNGGFSEMRQPNSKVFKGLGPSEFVYMISNASFLITDSFHGTSFGTIFNIPMIGIVKEKNAGDGRIATLRRRVNSEKSIVQYDSYKTNDLSFDLNDYKCDLVLLNEFREQSSILLNNMIKNA